jgi:hypothetical protein
VRHAAPQRSLLDGPFFKGNNAAALHNSGGVANRGRKTAGRVHALGGTADADR